MGIFKWDPKRATQYMVRKEEKLTNYFVIVLDLVDGKTFTVQCKDKDEVATLLTHIDDEKYKVASVNAIDHVHADIKLFCKKLNLEHGELKND